MTQQQNKVNAKDKDKARTEALNAEYRAFALNRASIPKTKGDEQLGEDQAKNTFNVANIADMEYVARKIETVDEDMKDSRVILRASEKILNQTPPHKVAPLLGDDGQRIGLKDFNSADKGKYFMVILALFVAVPMAIANVASNLLATDLPLFLDQPHLAYMIACILPLASVSIKNLGMHIRSPLWRRHYGLSINIATVGFALMWGWLFSMQYQGLADTGVGLGSMFDDEQTGPSGLSTTALIWSQMMIEMFMTSSLFLTLAELQEKYSPDRIELNPAHIEAGLVVDTNRKRFEALAEESANLHATLQQKHAERDRFVMNKSAEFEGLKARQAASNPDK